MFLFEVLLHKVVFFIEKHFLILLIVLFISLANKLYFPPERKTTNIDRHAVLSWKWNLMTVKLSIKLSIVGKIAGFFSNKHKTFNNNKLFVTLASALCLLQTISHILNFKHFLLLLNI